jgi:putative oxidoreductase
MSSLVDRIAIRSEGLLVLLGRLAIAVLFVPSGFEKLLSLNGFAQNLAAKGLPFPLFWAVLGAFTEFFGSLALAVGFRTRYAALLLIVFTAIGSVLSHHFWDIHDASRQMQYIQFMKNLAIIGGLLFLVARGAGPLSLDRGRR